MKYKNIIIFSCIFIIILCSGCGSNKSLDCILESDSITYRMKWDSKNTTAITEQTFDTEEEAISSEKYYKENFPEFKISRDGKKFITEITEKSDNTTYDEAKKDIESLGFTCK